MSQLYSSAAALVLVNHLALTTGPQFSESELSYWAAEVMRLGREGIQQAMAELGAELRWSAEQSIWGLHRAGHLASRVELGLLATELAQGCQGLLAAVDFKRLVQQVTVGIGGVFERLAPWNSRFVELSRVEVVQPAELWEGDGLERFMCCWEANGAGLTLLCPPISLWQQAHYTWQAKKHGLPAGAGRAEVLMQELLNCFLIPCHEVIHIAQTLHQQTDSDPKSFSAEHDASRLNLPLLWQVLQSGCAVHPPVPDWFGSVLMLQAINNGLRAQAAVAQMGPNSGRFEQAYREWVDSFGIKSPNPVFEEFAPDEDAKLTLESYFKTMVTAEALGAISLAETGLTEAHLASLLEVAFHPDRTGDVYSEENKSRCVIPDEHPLSLNGAWPRLATPNCL